MYCLWGLHYSKKQQCPFVVPFFIFILVWLHNMKPPYYLISVWLNNMKPPHYMFLAGFSGCFIGFLQGIFPLCVLQFIGMVGSNGCLEFLCVMLVSLLCLCVMLANLLCQLTPLLPFLQCFLYFISIKEINIEKCCELTCMWAFYTWIDTILTQKA